MRRDLALAAAVLAALLAVVGVASATGAAESETERTVGLPGGVFAWVYAGFVVAGAVAFPLFLSISARATPHRRTSRGRAWLLPLWLAAMAGLLLAARAALGDQFGEMLDRLTLDRDGPGVPTARRAGVPAPEAVPLAILAVLAFVVGVALYALRAARLRRRVRAARMFEELTALVDATIEELQAEPDARRAIVRAYAGMERTLARSGVERDGAEAPLEYVARVLLELDVRAEPVHALTELFERAKFSAHALGADAKSAAIEALEALRADLQTAPATP